MNQNVQTSGSSSNATGGMVVEPAAEKNQGPQKEVFYSPALEQLIAFRKDVAVFSFGRSQERLHRLKNTREAEALTLAENTHASALYKISSELSLNSSQFGDERPLTCVRYSPCGSVIASGSLGPVVKLWDASSLDCVAVLRNHADRITSVSWHPEAFSTPTSTLLSSTSGDGACVLWDCKNIALSSRNSGAMAVVGDDSSDSLCTPVSKLLGHQGVVSCSEFHPNGRGLLTCGHDRSWRLWDIETSIELQLQDGHTKECSAIGIHPDGSLAMTGDAGGVGILWDLRSGQCILPMQGHIKKITGISFHPNGTLVATSSIDHTAKIWDLRKKKCVYTLPAHNNILSDVKFSSSGELLLTSSFDGTLKVWGARDFHILRTLSGHSGKVMASDVSPDEKHFVSVGYDRTLKIWAHKDEF
jgi:U4/U6 small nuclear ribonucleoprotein PRP4